MGCCGMIEALRLCGLLCNLINYIQFSLEHISGRDSFVSRVGGDRRAAHPTAEKCKINHNIGLGGKEKS